MRVIRCDKCKKIQRVQKGKSFLENKWIRGDIHGGNPESWLSFDLCENCSKKLIKFIKRYLPR